MSLTALGVTDGYSSWALRAMEAEDFFEEPGWKEWRSRAKVEEIFEIQRIYFNALVMGKASERKANVRDFVAQCTKPIGDAEGFAAVSQRQLALMGAILLKLHGIDE